MTVSELIRALQKMPSDATVYYYGYNNDGDGYWEECEDREPEPTLGDDGRVRL